MATINVMKLQRQVHYVERFSKMTTKVSKMAHVILSQLNLHFKITSVKAEQNKTGVSPVISS